MHKHHVFEFLGLSLVLSLLATNPAKADDLYGRIRGAVSDKTGAVVVGASVTATDAATGLTKSVATGPDGSYELLQLPAPATYKVTVQRTGFRTYDVTGIDLNLNQIYVLNATLEVGSLTQRVTVEAAATQVERTSMQLGRTLTASQIVDLPLNGRNWVALQQTLPGVVASDRFTNNYATNGSRSQSNGYLVNGIDANDLPLNTPQVIPSPDAIGEVSMITNTINPEYGRNGGAILNATTKNGTNQFHGDGFEFYRDDSLNTRNFFSPSRTVFHQHQFGGTVGGPIKKEKAFFFFSYQGTRNRVPGTGGSTSVFTSAQRTGDFSAGAGALTGSSAFPLLGENGTVFPAGTRYSTIFPTKHIPTSDFNPISANLLNTFVPTPNLGSNTFLFNPVNTQVTDQYISRIDFNPSTKDSIFGYWFIEPNRLLRDIPFTGATLLGFGDKRQSRTQQYALNWNHTFSGTTLNEARVGYQRLNFRSVIPQNPVLPSSVGFTGINPQNTVDAGLPKMTITGLFTLGFSNNGPQPRIDQTYQVTDNFSKIIGRHTFKAGFDMRRSQVSNPFFGNNNGNFAFQGAGTYSTGNAGLDFLLGAPDQYTQGSGGFIDARTQTYYSYGQDQWKVRPNLTVTYGVGWQIDTPIKDIANGGVSVNCFIPGQQSTVFPTAPAGLDFPGDTNCNSAGGVTTRYAHFAPRVGFAWSPRNSQKWAIRGGYGIYYDRVEEELTLQFLNAPPIALTSNGIADASGTPSFANPFTDIRTGRSIPNKFPFTPPKVGSAVDFSFFEPLTISVLDPNFSTPYTQNFNLTMEHELPGTMIFSASYVGLLGRKLVNTIELNPAGGINGNPVCAATPGCNSFNNYFTAPQTFRFPQTNNGALIFGGVGQQATFINSNYNALQLTLDKKTSHGLNFRAAYSWSHSLDGSSSFEDLGFSGTGGGLNPFNLRANYGDSAYDARNRFVFSYTYAIPSVRHFSAFEKLPSRLTDGWRMSGVATFQTGIPITVGDGAFRSFTCSAVTGYYGCWDRPNTVGPVSTFDIRTSSANNSLNGTRPPRGVQDHYWFDPNAFGLEPVGTIGNAGRNFFHGPGINNWDFALFKDTRITESTRLELRFEFFNFLNHAQFSATGVTANSNSANFGRDLNARPFSSTIDSRLIQLAAKFYF